MKATETPPIHYTFCFELIFVMVRPENFPYCQIFYNPHLQLHDYPLTYWNPQFKHVYSVRQVWKKDSQHDVYTYTYLVYMKI